MEKTLKPKYTRNQEAKAYGILDDENCPYTLPKARSMTQARIDLHTLMPKLFEWEHTYYNDWIN